MTYRNSRLTRLCHQQPCMLKITGICTGGEDSERPSVPAHSNMLRHGRGHGHKSHDCYTVPACPACHYWLDYGKAPREVKQMAFDAAFEDWILYQWENELVRVA